VRTRLAGEHGPRVGTPRRGPLRRFARDPRLDRLLLELQRGFGPQRWWPAETPFEVAVGAVLTQNTAWTNVERAIARLRAARRLTPARILATEPAALEELVRPSGTFRAKARKLAALSRFWLDAGGLAALRRRRLPELRAALLAVHGIGPETADSILCYAVGKRSAVVDAYARRVLGRHGLVDGALPYEELRAWLHERLVDSQAVYEEFHALVVQAGKLACRREARCERCVATAPDAPGGGRL